MDHWRKGVWIFLLLFIGMASMGCAVFLAAGAGAGVGIGAAEYIRGELKQSYTAPMEKTWQASLAAAEELKMRVAEKSIDNLNQNRVIKGKTDEGRDFQIALEATSKEVTAAKVRIGVFGDEAYSKRIQELIAKNLKQ
ncbi:MAG: DUF3568 domain-containing protein [Deltaproteobacteria bacterium]|nr:DUF3568 domain-containing protein [Deltaproteobacteria bacterium]